MPAPARLAVPPGRLEIDVVPLFVTRADLESATSVLTGCWSCPPGGSGSIDAAAALEVMLGYWDATLPQSWGPLPTRGLPAGPAGVRHEPGQWVGA